MPLKSSDHFTAWYREVSQLTNLTCAHRDSKKLFIASFFLLEMDNQGLLSFHFEYERERQKTKSRKDPRGRKTVQEMEEIFPPKK